MPLTELDKASALVLIDLQKGIVGLPVAHPAQDVIAKASSLASAFRKHGLPVVLVNAYRPGAWSYGCNCKFQVSRQLDGVGRRAHVNPQDHLVSKERWGAFIGTDLDQHLRSKGVTQIFLGGIATCFGVESTARCAYDLGYNVVLVSDAMTDMDIDAHNNAIEKIFPRLGQVDTAGNIIEKLSSAAIDIGRLICLENKTTTNKSNKPNKSNTTNKPNTTNRSNKPNTRSQISCMRSGFSFAD